ncbi:hypothetical protein [Bradyrhizobium sp. 151]|uniref:hypothetical protein n=1 Tax=Bradyrhizobium sp. 151 TaxID=2782626 RepID=UPI001FF945D4|nr:hypothetical protein [Bradyrhizobium sp. 151]MCK1658480.1 hypothetical protein [Bradyrhizobium sp. 151]
MRPASAQQDTDETFNKTILRAVDTLFKNYKGGGYDIKKAYTHRIEYGGGEIKPSDAPWTMCVAAVAEVIATAVAIHASETNDKTVFDQLPVIGWNRMRPTDIRSHLWVDPRLDSYGTADALVTFGIGKRVKFSELKPGSFVNINRTNRTGHAVVFINYLDKSGAPLEAYSDKVAGFRYFSAQNRNSHGLGYGYAFFTGSGYNSCPALSSGEQPDCGVIYSTGQKMLNTGFMLHPGKWNKEARETNMKALLEGLYVQTRSRGDDYLGIPSAVDFDEFLSRIESTDTMRLNPIFEQPE